MPKKVIQLTDIKVKTAKAQEKPYKLADGEGLFVHVMPNGAKYWRMKARYCGQERLLSFGSLADARAARAKAAKQIAEGIDPAQAKRIEKIQKAAAVTNTFEAIARQWHSNKLETWKENTAKDALNRLEKDVFPLIGKRPIAEIDGPTMLDVLRRVERRGALEMTRRLGQLCSQVFKYAIASGYVKYNPMPDLVGALKPRVKGHHAAITPDELPEFLRVF